MQGLKPGEFRLVCGSRVAVMGSAGRAAHGLIPRLSQLC